MNKFSYFNRSPGRSGSALVITLLMVSIISTITFSITALSISEFRKASNLQDSIAAYYAAESGIEHGLLQQRIWRDAEISREVYDHIKTEVVTELPQSVIPTADRKKGTPQTYRLSGIPGFVGSGGDKGPSWYDLKMHYRVPNLGLLNDDGRAYVDPAKSPRVYRDSALEISLDGASALDIAWDADPETNQLVKDGRENVGGTLDYFVEIILTADTAEVGVTCPSSLRRVVLIYAPDVDVAPDQRTALNPIDFEGCNYRSARIKPWNMKYMQYGIKLLKNNANILMDSGFTTIESTGYAGKAKRTLKIDFSRNNQTILESEDFLFLSADGLLEFK